MMAANPKPSLLPLTYSCFFSLPRKKRGDGVWCSSEKNTEEGDLKTSVT